MLTFAKGVDLSEFRPWLSRAWYEVCGELSEEHLRAGTSCTKTVNWRQVSAYLSKYIAKPETLQDLPAGIGSHYGIWESGSLVSRLMRFHVSLEDAQKIRRWYRKFSGKRVRGDLERSDLEIFVNYSTTLRLLRFLGYYPRGSPGPPAGASGTDPVGEDRGPGAGPRVCAGRPLEGTPGRGVR